MLRPVFNSNLRPGVMETHRFPANEGQSTDFVSYKAVRDWHGFWRVVFCDYLLRQRVPITKNGDSALKKGPVKIQTAIAESKDFYVFEKPVKNWLTGQEAFAFLQEQEKRLVATESKGLAPFLTRMKIQPHTDYYNQYAAMFSQPPAPIIKHHRPRV